MRRVLEILFLSVIVIASSCNRDGVITIDSLPEIILGSEEGVYSVKQGEEIRIAPNYTNVEDAEFEWVMDNEVVCRERAYIFLAEEIGSYYITLRVTTPIGSDEEELRVDVVEREIPTIEIIGEAHRILCVGTAIELHTAVAETNLSTTISWSLDGESVGHGESYRFEASAIGDYTLRATATNDDGESYDEVVIEVVAADAMPFKWEFSTTEYHGVAGRKILIKPTALSHSEGVSFAWHMEGSATLLSSEAHCIFTADVSGEYRLSATAMLRHEEGEISIEHSFCVTVYDEADSFRPQGASSSLNFNKVYEYTPAPGQFINELRTGGFDGTQTTREAAVEYAKRRMEANKWVSLGAFGGYIVVGFDHSIAASGDYDFAILGNSFDGSSEPGVVWVMQDENRNGKPDDTWYELRGSETGAEGTIQNYEVTYYRPAGPAMSVQWIDNMGGSGDINYLKNFHNQEYYFPLWIEGESYTLSGTRLEARNYDKSGNGSLWVQPAYDWGYADNCSTIDRLTDNEHSDAKPIANNFKISNAIDFEGEAVELSHIDFVKVQSAVQAESGWLGELSTEVCGFYAL